MLNEKRYMYYDASWRLIHEEVADAATTAGPNPVRAEQQVWGLRYIDDAILRRRAPITDLPACTLDWPDAMTNGNAGKPSLIPIFWQLTDVQFSVTAVLDQAGRVLERVDYTPYGVARNLSPSPDQRKRPRR